jgi:hypothetical protein
MQPRRDVKQNPRGGWDVLKEGHRRAATRAETRGAAVSKAREQIQREGGGEIRIIDQTGKIAESRTVARPAGQSRRS